MDIILDRPTGKQKVTIDPALFTIDPSDLDRDMCSIGKVLVECGSIEAELRTEVARKEAALEKLYADLDATVRVSANATGEKVTEGRVKSMIIATTQYTAALESLHESSKNANISRWVMVALQKKADCLLAMSYRESRLSKFER